MSSWKSLMKKFQNKSKIAEVHNIIVKVIHISCQQDSRCGYRNSYSRPPELVMNQFQNIGAITSNGAAEDKSIFSEQNIDTITSNGAAEDKSTFPEQYIDTTTSDGAADNSKREETKSHS